MINCCFWNLNRKRLGTLVAHLSQSEDLGVICLAEVDDAVAVVDEIRNLTGVSFSIPESDTPKVNVLVRNSDWDLSEVYADISGRLSIRKLLIEGAELLLVVVHLPSKVNWESLDQAALVQTLSDQIRDEESRRGHQRTILCGDLNMNPFEFGVVSATGLHAMSTKSSVQSKTRTVQGREYPFFYNPMWGLMGDRTDGPPGTHFYRHSGPLSYDWQLFDQVMFRADALPWFNDHVEIVTKIGQTHLDTERGRPNNNVGSDHFPIVFRVSNRVTDVVDI